MLHKILSNAWKIPNKELMRSRLIEWRKQPSILRIERPTNLASARSKGYKAKKGFVIARVKISRGGRKRARPKGGRKSSKLRVKKIVGMNYNWVAEQRAQKRYKNLEVLNSYKVGKDGKHYFIEVILVDPNHPVINSDKNLNWIGKGANRKRVYRGLTSSARKSRGLRRKGKGAEKVRPSLRANKGRLK